MRHLLQQHGLRLVRQHDAPKLGTLEFGDGLRPGRRDREERIRREEIEAEAAGVADAGPYADRNDRREDSAAAIEDETGEKHAGQQQEISRLPVCIWSAICSTAHPTMILAEMPYRIGIGSRCSRTSG